MTETLEEAEEVAKAQNSWIKCCATTQNKILLVYQAVQCSQDPILKTDFGLNIFQPIRTGVVCLSCWLEIDKENMNL